MTALRTTTPKVLRAAAAALTLLGAAGCGGPPPRGDDTRPAVRLLAPPAAERINYNPDTRTLTLYPLPPSSRWVVQTTQDIAAQAVQVGPIHVLPKNVNPGDVYVSYKRPSGQTSGWVTVNDVIAARATHASNTP